MFPRTSSPAAHALLAVALSALPSPLAAQATGDEAPVVALALSGGSAKPGVRVDAVAGTSMGAVVGGLYAIGLSVDSIETIMSDADWSALIGDGVPRRRLFLDQRRLDERTVLNVPLRERRITLPAGAIVGSNVMRTLEHVTWRAATVRRFDQLPRPFVAVATDLETGAPVSLREGVLSEAIRASSGVPGAVEPFELDGRLLVDGALSRNLPASDARNLGADVVICSDVTEPLDSADELRSMVDVLTQLASLSIVGATLEQRGLCDVLIMPDVEGLSGLDFELVADWVERGGAAASEHIDELLRVVELQVRGVPPERPDPPPTLLSDSIRITRIGVAGTEDARVVELVRRELELEPDAFVGRAQMETRLGDLDATGLFGLVRYRLEEDGADRAALTIVVQERPRDRLGVGLRYDDERQAALLFTASVHNLLRYGSLTRIDLRVGEETQVGISFNRRRGVTGRLGSGLALGWNQAPLALGTVEGGPTTLEILRGSVGFGFGVGRATYLGVEGIGERTVSSTDSAEVLLVSGTALLDHETLDRGDFPTSGADVTARIEWGATDVTERGWFSVWTIEARSFVPLHRRVSLDLGGFLGYARGPDLPAHRRFFVGGAHRSAVFRSTQPGFHGLESQEQAGGAVQIGRAGLRVQVGDALFLRAGVDIGGVQEDWEFPLEDPLTGWALSAGVGSLVGPITLEVSQLGSDRDPRVSVGVGRWF